MRNSRSEPVGIARQDQRCDTEPELTIAIRQALEQPYPKKAGCAGKEDPLSSNVVPQLAGVVENGFQV